MTHPGDDQLAAYAIGEADAAEIAAIEGHVAECARCRGELGASHRLLDEASDLDVPFRDDGYGARVWAKLEPQLPQTNRRAWTVSGRPWLAAAAVFLVAVGAFVVGRWSLETKQQAAATVSQSKPADPAAIRERIVLAAVGEHLERTERGLVRLVNEDANVSVDIAAEQAGRALPTPIASTGSRCAALDRRPLVSSLDQLEPVLLDLVHSPARLRTPEFEALRARIDEQSLLFKVRVTSSDVRARERALRRPGVQTS